MLSCDLAPFQEFGLSWLLIDKLAAAEAHKETKGGGRERYGGMGKPICTLEICCIRT